MVSRRLSFFCPRSSSPQFRYRNGKCFAFLVTLSADRSTFDRTFWPGLGTLAAFSAAHLAALLGRLRLARVARRATELMLENEICSLGRGYFRPNLGERNGLLAQKSGRC